MKTILFRASLLVVVISVLIRYYFYTSQETTAPTRFASFLSPRIRSTLADMFQSAANALTPPPQRAMLLQSLYWKTTILQALTHHKLMDAVDGKTDCGTIAASRGLNADYTCRFLRAGMSMGLLTSPSKQLLRVQASDVYQVTATGELFQRHHPNTVADLYDMMNSNLFRESLHAVATKSIKSGRSGFQEAFGMELFEYLVDHPQEGEAFDMAMNQITTKIATALVQEWVPPHPNATFCDIGGGQGTIVAALLQKHVGLKGILFDLPDTAQRAQTYIAEIGLSDRIDVVAGDFFRKLPERLSGCDVFYLKAIFHDWGDDSCVTIIRNIKDIARSGSMIVGHDIVLGIGDGPTTENTKVESDITMMAMCAGGRERTKDEYFALFKRAGIAASPRLTKVQALPSVVEVDLHDESMPQSPR